ncbi:hypothetical protein V2J09_006055 [Rumex salicifolius]
MFLKVRMSWNVIIAAENLDVQGLLLQRAILVKLLEDFAAKKATKDLGNLLAVTTVDKIGEGKVRPHTGDVLFPVDFTCLTFRFFRGEIIEGVVTKILKHGVFLSCGPVETVFVSAKKMPGYELVPGDENQMFVSQKRAKLEKNTVVRVSLMDSKWVESERAFMALGSLDGDHLGAKFDAPTGGKSEPEAIPNNVDI